MPGPTGVPWTPECGARVRRARKAKAMTGPDLAHAMGWSPHRFPDVSKIERARNSVSGRTLVQLADALDVSTDWLLGRRFAAALDLHKAVWRLNEAGLRELRTDIEAVEAVRRIASERWTSAEAVDAPRRRRAGSAHRKGQRPPQGAA